ncbi:sensor histidine kinase [Streptomyces sp. YIM S03343]
MNMSSTSWKARAARHPRATEAVALLLLFAVTVVGTVMTAVISEKPLPLWPGLVLSSAACLALLLRRRYPLSVLAVVGALTMAEGAIGYLLSPLIMGPLMTVLYLLGLRADRTTSRNAALLVTTALVLTALFLDPQGHPVMLGVVNPAAWVLLSTLLGSYVAVRRAYAAERVRQEEQAREDEARRRVVQERIRIARELHDVVAHHLALANAQAGTAVHLYHSHPAETYEMLTALSETTAAALRELKATVGVLRQDTEPESDDGRSPAPGLAQLPDLTASCASAGLAVTVTVEGDPQPLSPGTDLTAFRIVQEALTNVTKHASTRRADVRLTYVPHALTLTITNDTPSPAVVEPVGRGFGLIGMRERAHSVGGTLTTGPRPGGGFQVRCTLPLHPTD